MTNKFDKTEEELKAMSEDELMEELNQLRQDVKKRLLH